MAPVLIIIARTREDMSERAKRHADAAGSSDVGAVGSCVPPARVFEPCRIRD